MAFAAAKYAFGICDICSQRFRLKTLQTQWDGMKACYECFDVKQPQLEAPHVRPDAEALLQPRPDVSVVPSAFTVYTNVGLGIIGTVLTTPTEMTASLGDVTITVI